MRSQVSETHQIDTPIPNEQNKEMPSNKYTSTFPEILMVQTQAKENDACKTELLSWLSSEKWWPNWIGFILSSIAAVLSLKYDSSLISFNTWHSYQSFGDDLWLNYNMIIGILCLYPIIFISFALCDYCTNKSFKQILIHLRGFSVFYILSIICFLIGSQTNMKDYGMGYAILSLFIGMSMINIANIFNSSGDWLTNFLSGATQKGEFYIKCGLVLLATDFNKIVNVGVPGLIISWLIPPIIILFMWYLAIKWLRIKNRKVIIALSSGTAICGVSAIVAVGAVVEMSTEDTAMTVSILSFFTTFFMLIVPYIAMFAGFNNIVSGAWIGGSVDGTGNVVASVGILDNDMAYETAVIIKMAQNILIGVVCLIIAFIFKHENDTIDHDGKSTSTATVGGEDGSGKTGKTLNTNTKPKREMKSNKCAFLWKKFPKFIIGFLLLSIIISAIIQPFASQTYSTNFQTLIKQFSKWLFCFGFLGIGANTIFSKLYKQIKNGKVLALYLIGQIIDTIFTLLVAWAVVKYLM